MPAPVVTVRYDGGRELEAALQVLVDDFDASKATVRNVMKRGLVEAGELTAAAARAIAPDDPSTPAPDLHTSIVASARLSNRVGKAEFAAVLKSGGSRTEASAALRAARSGGAGQGSVAEAYVGVTGVSRFYAHLVEFGTAHSPPKPFLRPAWDATKDAVLGRIREAVMKQLAKAIARAKRKALRAVAK